MASVRKNLALSESGFIFDPESGDSFSVNPQGLEILNLIREGKTEAEIRRQILDHYFVDEATFEKDFYDFLSMLGRFNLTEKQEQHV